MTTESEEIAEGVLTITIGRGKVNALNLDVVAELRQAFHSAKRDDVRAVVLTGRGHAFFSFGFDVPHYRAAPREEFQELVAAFCALCDAIFTFPKPVVAAINGHAIAGGCMLALACDLRIMVPERARIALNEIGFGSTVFAGSTEMLRFAIGSRNASRMLMGGELLTAAGAAALGVVDVVATDAVKEAREEARRRASLDPYAHASLKRLLREPVAVDYRAREAASIREFLDIWYSDATQAKLAGIEIRG